MNADKTNAWLGLAKPISELCTATPELGDSTETQFKDVSLNCDEELPLLPLLTRGKRAKDALSI